MGKLKDTILILGEGFTESFYLDSLKEEYPAALQNVEPKIPKHTSLKELEKRIEKAIIEGFSKVFCMIDMDNKKSGVAKDNYARLKKKYSTPIIKPRKGISCEVKFFETERCTELFFLYYFKYKAKEYNTSEEVVKELEKECCYRKEIKFFASHPLHLFFEKNGGKLEQAISNSEKSCKTAIQNHRDYGYSQLGEMLKELLNL